MTEGRKHANGAGSLLRVHVISDATGEGAERMARAALVQYRKDVKAEFVRHAFVVNAKRLEKALDQAEHDQGLVIYTMTDRNLRIVLEESQYDRHLELIDMLGPILRKVGRRYKVRPLLDSGLLPDALGEKALRLAKAIDFTLEHDDGKRIESLGQADIILLGVSRTNKTPTSMYLSCHHGLKVANVPLTPMVKPPAKIYTLKRPRLVGLTIAAQKLAHVRRNRFKQGEVKSYYDIHTIARELAHAEEVFERIKGIRVIDVTDRTIEEVANLIV